MQSVESNWAVFGRRLMQFQSRWSIWKQMWSQTIRTIVFSRGQKSTIVLSYSKSADTD